MKKVFIGLLIIAAGAGAFYFLQKKKNENTIEKELLTGKWKMDSLHLSPKDSANLITALLLSDSNFHKYQYDFQKGWTFVQALSDSAKADTSYYEWGKKNELMIKESVKDSTGEIFLVNKLSMDSLIVQSKDSTVFVLTKLK